MAITVARTRRFSFRAVHSLHVGAHREKTHGHQYFLEVTFRDCSAELVEREVVQRILDPLDRHDLTAVLAPATGEVVVEWIHKQLEDPGCALHGKILAIAVQETRKNRFVSSRSEEHFQ